MKGRGIDSLIFFKLDTLGHNRILIASEDEAFISDALRNLHLLKSVDKISVDVYGLSKWRYYETIELKNFHSVNTHLFLSTNVDYNDENVREFIEHYRTVFKSEPSAYSFRGYDITTYFLTALSKYGREFPKYIQDREQNLLQTNVKFRKTGKGAGFRNEATKNIIYLPHWEIIEW